MKIQMYLYFYEAYNGKLIPGIWTGKLKDLKNMFKDSTTPLKRWIKVSKKDKTIILMLKVLRDNTPQTEIGMLHSINWAIKKLHLYK